MQSCQQTDVVIYLQSDFYFKAKIRRHRIVGQSIVLKNSLFWYFLAAPHKQGQLYKYECQNIWLYKSEA